MPALIYCRVSSERQKKEGHGLDSQEHRGRVHAAQKGYIVEEVFRDSASGGLMERPAMIAMLKYIDAHPHKNYVVVFDDLSRFSRDVQVHLRLRQEFKQRDAIVECPNFTFEDTPEGQMVEVIMAAQSAYHRHSNRRQVIQKQKARLERGYWPFYPPPGLTHKKDSVHGKLLVPEEPHALILREALEGYASGTLNEQMDVVRFLQAKGFTNRNGKKLQYVTQVRRLLSRPIYAGYIEYEEWEITRRKGHHEGLISVETYERIQARLTGAVRLNDRKDIHEDFPLRGFVLCASCNRHLTASWSRGRRARHAYYHCQAKGCDRYGKSIRRAVIEEQFVALLSHLKPGDGVVNLTAAIFKDMWANRSHYIEKSIQGNEKRIEQIQQEIETVTDRIVKTTSGEVVQVYESKIEKLRTELSRLVAEVERGKQAKDSGFEEAMEQVLHFLGNPLCVWENGEIHAKKLVLKLAFSADLAYHHESGYRTPQLSPVLRVFSEVSSANSQHVEMRGIEPRCKEKRIHTSTRRRAFKGFERGEYGTHKIAPRRTLFL